MPFSLADLRAIPATALRGLPRDGSVEELLSKLVVREVMHAYRIQKRTRRRKK